MRGIRLLSLALAVSLVLTAPEAAVGQEQDQGTSVDAGDGKVRLGTWIEVGVPDRKRPSGGGSPPPCHLQQGDDYDLLRWVGLDPNYFPVLDADQQFVFNLCRVQGSLELASFWAYRPPPAPPPTTQETTQLRNEAWGLLAIPEPRTRMAPNRVTIVQIPTFVWVPDADRTPVSETVTTVLNGHELSLTATAYPRRLGFLRVDMGDGNTLWCDADDVAAFDHARDPHDQPSKCFHYYRYSSVDQPDLRYQVVVTAYWDVSVVCVFNGGPCTNPPPAVPTQALTAPPHPIAVAEIQALASPG